MRDWQQIRDSGDIQYAPIPPQQIKPPDPPGWLKSLGEWLDSVLRAIFEPLGKMLGLSWPVVQWVLIGYSLSFGESVIKIPEVSAVGASEGYIYLRSEYPHAVTALEHAVDTAYSLGFLGADILGSGFRFDLHVRMGAGAYICGEESAMLESLEGKRGEVRAKPPIPAISGLFGRPTVVNNMLTLCAVPMILSDGGQAYADLGTGRSRGTQVFQLAGNIARGGIVELPFGVTLGELVEDYGGGTRSGRPVRAVQVGGPLGAYLPPERFDLPMDYEAFAEADAMVGHGGIVVFDDTVDMARMARFAMEFCSVESCGKCTPCRVGSTRGVETIDRIVAGRDVDANLVLLQDLCETMTKGSLCAMGGLTPMPVQSALRHWPEDFTSPRSTTEGASR